jgi:plastocyanin
MRPIRLDSPRSARRLLAAALAAFAGSAAMAAGAATHTVVIDGVSYSPATLTVKRGDTVTWVNKDPFPHTVTAKGAFDSKDIAAGAKWKYVARKAGTYDYICTYHPNMKGTLKVE